MANNTFYVVTGGRIISLKYSACLSYSLSQLTLWSIGKENVNLKQEFLCVQNPANEPGTYLLNYSHPYSITYLLTYSLPSFFPYLLTYSLPYFDNLITYLLTYLLIYLLNYSLPYLITHLLTYLLTHFLLYLLTYLLTY
jgi:hypothetical protein